LGTIGGLIVGGAGGYAASQVLGDDVETIVDALVDKLYNKTDTNQQAVTPTSVDQEPTSAPNAATSRKPVAGDEDIVALQTILKNDGYDLGTYGPNSDGIDGKLGPKTISAIQQDLAKLGAKNSDGSPLAVTGSINPSTSQAMQQYYLS
jgi:peptidoglycan hydrolase-like protein with peptidoglycan-binding domain